jgi:hypothetical protein
MNKIHLTHLWLYNGYLMCNEKTYGKMVLCTEDAFYAGKNDSLKKNWLVSESGIRYREIKRTKRCHITLPGDILKSISDRQYADLIETSFKSCYNS